MNNDPNVPNPTSPNLASEPTGSAPPPRSDPGTPAAATAPATYNPGRGGRPSPPEKPQTPVFGCLFAVSVLFNIGAALVLIIVCAGVLFNSHFGSSGSEGILTEKVLAGNETAKEKVAVIQLDGVIMEGTLNYVHKQIEQAGKDKQVKAVVLRINSPGGSITASAELHRRLTELTNGNKAKKYDSRPLVVSMGSIAASGGYYVAMPGKVVYAEESTMTGSIGVYGAFLNVSKLADEHGVTMNIIKAGDIKDSGSPFKQMTPEERQVWQDMIDHAYNQFLDVVVQGRKDQQLNRLDLLNKFDVTPVKVGDKPRGKPYQRNIADGGVWTADKAKELKLIDEIGTLEDAIQKAHDLAKMGSDYKAVEYEKPKSLSETLFGVQGAKPVGLNSPLLDPARLRNSLTPRLWYLAPGSELAGMLAAVEADHN